MYVSLSAPMILDFDEIWCGYYTIGGYPKLILFNFLQSVIPIWWTEELSRWE
jgi:hypothetical protein